MRILLVSQYFPPEPSRIGDLAQGLTERGHEVTALTGKPNYPGGSFYPGYGFFRPAREAYHGAQVVRVPLVPRGDGSGWRLALNYLSYAFFASFLGPLFCRGKFDLVFVCQLSPFTVGVPGIVLRALKQAPMMFWIQDLWPESLRASGVVRSPLIVRPIEKLVRFTYERCDRILVTSEGFVSRIEARGAEGARVRYWPQWAEALYKPVETEKDAPERSEMPDSFKVVFAGNVGAGQSFETIVAAARKLKDYPEIHWIVLGDGRKRPWVEEQVRELGLEGRLRLLGSRPMEAMPRYFALADAMLVTLKKDLIFSLTVPGKVQSYLACGRPVVAALDGEGARVIEEAEAGLTVPAEDADALAEAVLTLYKTPKEKREEMGRRGRAYFEEHFEREKLLDRLEGWMEELIGGET